MNTKRQFAPSLDARSLERRDVPASLSPVNPGAPFVPKFPVPPADVFNVPRMQTNIVFRSVRATPVFGFPVTPTDGLRESAGVPPGQSLGLTGTGSNTGSGVYGFGNPFYLGTRFR